jgi:TRAP-type mannitol/chloroaromatic compound transport system permease small subunit
VLAPPGIAWCILGLWLLYVAGFNTLVVIGTVLPRTSNNVTVAHFEMQWYGFDVMVCLALGGPE